VAEEDEHRALRQGLGNAVLAEQDGFGLRGVDDTLTTTSAHLCGLGRRLRAASTVGDEPCHGIVGDNRSR